MQDKLDIVVLQSPGELNGTTHRLDWLETYIQQGEFAGSDLLVLPELFQCGYRTAHTITDVAEAPDGPFAKHIARLCKTHDMAIAYGYAELADDGIYNSAQCIDSHGETMGHHRKLLLPPGHEPSIFDEGKDYQLFQLKGFTLSILICYDAEFPENVRHMSASGAQLIIVPTALARQWGVVSEKLIPTRAFENGVFVAYANHCGSENETTYFGGSCIVAPNGSDLARAGGEHCALKATITKQQVEEAQRQLPYLAAYSHLPCV